MSAERDDVIGQREHLERALVREMVSLRKHYGRLSAYHFDGTPLLNQHVGQGIAEHTFRFFLALAEWMQEDREVRIALGTLGVNTPGGTAKERMDALVKRENVGERHFYRVANAGLRKIAQLIRSWSDRENFGGPVIVVSLVQVTNEVVRVAINVERPIHVLVNDVPEVAINGEPVTADWTHDERRPTTAPPCRG